MYPDLKAVLPTGNIDCGEVDHVAELGVGVIPKEHQHRYDSLWVDHNFQLVVASYLKTQSTSCHEGQSKLELMLILILNIALYEGKPMGA